MILCDFCVIVCDNEGLSVIFWDFLWLCKTLILIVIICIILRGCLCACLWCCMVVYDIVWFSVIFRDFLIICYTLWLSVILRDYLLYFVIICDIVRFLCDCFVLLLMILCDNLWYSTIGFYDVIFCNTVWLSVLLCDYLRYNVINFMLWLSVVLCDFCDMV